MQSPGISAARVATSLEGHKKAARPHGRWRAPLLAAHHGSTAAPPLYCCTDTERLQFASAMALSFLHAALLLGFHLSTAQAFMTTGVVGVSFGAGQKYIQGKSCYSMQAVQHAHLQVQQQCLRVCWAELLLYANRMGRRQYGGVLDPHLKSR